ncbi:hypothetical protein KJ816_01390 [Patescibacteria group bacterium]|nr:hypothetical protein [Patescibacteria group bacterium]
MGEDLETPKEETEDAETINSIVEEVEQEVRKPTSEKEESEIKVGSLLVSEKDRKRARAMWATLHQDWISELTKRQIVYKSKLKEKEVNRLLQKYFSVTKQTSRGKYYKWNELYNVPAIDDPGWPLFEETPEEPKEDTDTYQHTMPGFF